MGSIAELAQKTGSTIIPADATSDLENLVDQAVAIFGKIDFVLHSIGMSVNVRKGNHYTNQNYEYTEKGWNVSAVSFHKVMHCIKKTP
jgi:enoyl-[acyl-carrier protein] reductase I